MFELRLQIGFYDQNLVKKEDFETKSDLFWQKTQVYYNTIWVYTFLEHIFVFLCKVQGV